MTELRFYLDENIPPEIETQLARHGIQAISVRSLDKLGDSDENHLQRAARMGYVLCTHDRDYLRMHGEGVNHPGIAHMQHFNASIGAWVRGLRDLHARISAEDAKGQVFFILAK